MMQARSQNILSGLVFFLLLLPGCGYNDLQGLDEETNAAWSEVLNQYQRRADLIPNLVATVKGYAAHEQETLEGVTQARSQVAGLKLTPEALKDPSLFQKFQNIIVNGIDFIADRFYLFGIFGHHRAVAFLIALYDSSF